MKVLVAGWFSFDAMGATAGDLLARDLTCEWLESAGVDVEVATAPSFPGGVDWQSVDPGDYSLVVFVCGPFGNGWPLTEFLARFEGCRLIGLNLSMLQPLDVWNPFDLLLERDSSTGARPDISFLSQQERVPVVGIVLVHRQSEYEGNLHDVAEKAFERLTSARELSIVFIDTRLDVANEGGLRTPAEIESLIAKMDVVLTTRLHGLVLALKNGVPAVAVDPISGGAKILQQAQTIGWPLAFAADSVTDEELDEAFDFSLTSQARSAALECASAARAGLGELREEFLAGLQVSPKGE